MNTKAAIYIRVSENKQDSDKNGFGEQMSKCKLMIDRQGWELHKVYSDRISSLTSLDKREELTQLIKDGEKEMFSHVVFCSLDRLGKKTKYILDIVQQMRRAGINPISICEIFDDSAHGEFILVCTAGLIQYAKNKTTKC